MSLGAALAAPMVCLAIEGERELRRRRNERVRRAMDGDDEALSALSGDEMLAVLEYRLQKEATDALPTEEG